MRTSESVSEPASSHCSLWNVTVRIVSRKSPSSDRLDEHALARGPTHQRGARATSSRAEGSRPAADSSSSVELEVDGLRLPVLHPASESRLGTSSRTTFQRPQASNDPSPSPMNPTVSTRSRRSFAARAIVEAPVDDVDGCSVDAGRTHSSRRREPRSTVRRGGRRDRRGAERATIAAARPAPRTRFIGRRRAARASGPHGRRGADGDAATQRSAAAPMKRTTKFPPTT